jgi:hypothetical protein
MPVRVFLPAGNLKTRLVSSSGSRVMSTQVTAILIGCVAQKQALAGLAKDLYVSELFRRRRAYAEATERPWLILSALHGIVDPEVLLEPYEMTLKKLPKGVRETWGHRVVDQLQSRFGPLSGLTFEIHAGEEYVASIARLLGARGALLVRPLHGLRLGQQLQWYGRSVAGVKTKKSRKSA